MDNTFILNSSASIVDLKDAISDKILKAKSITSSLLACCNTDSELSIEFRQGALWAIDEYLEQLESMVQQLEKIRNNSHYNDGCKNTKRKSNRTVYST